MESSSRCFSNDYVHGYFDQIGPFNRYIELLEDPLTKEGFGMLQRNYDDLSDMPSRPLYEPDELPMCVISFGDVKRLLLKVQLRRMHRVIKLGNLIATKPKLLLGIKFKVSCSML